MRARTLVAMMSALYVLTACSGSAVVTDPRPFGTFEWDSQAAAPGAEIDGTLQLVDGCLMVGSDWGEDYPLVLPNIATWDSETQTVTIEDQSFTVGEHVSWGGGYGMAEFADSLPPSCPDAEWAIAYTF